MEIAKKEKNNMQTLTNTLVLDKEKLKSDIEGYKGQI